MFSRTSASSAPRVFLCRYSSKAKPFGIVLPHAVDQPAVAAPGNRKGDYGGRLRTLLRPKLLSQQADEPACALNPLSARRTEASYSLLL